MKSINDKGEYALWDKGNLIGWERVDMVDGRKVLAKHKPTIEALKNAAAKDGVIINLNSGFRTFEEQFTLRKQNVIDRTKKEDEHYLLTASPGSFKPSTAIPGTSNHQDGGAYDFAVNRPGVYEWMIRNAHGFGFIRTVKTEPWHWEIRPGVDMFDVVPKDHESWKNLV